MFLDNDSALFGFYGVNYYSVGDKTEVLVDDFLPCDVDTGEPIFANSAIGSFDLWPLIMEKAWAKLHGSYMKMTNGSHADVFRDLTGAPTYEYPAADNDTEMLLEAPIGYITYMVSKKASEFEGGADGAKKLGIIPDCAY